MNPMGDLTALRSPCIHIDGHKGKAHLGMRGGASAVAPERLGPGRTFSRIVLS